VVEVGCAVVTEKDRLERTGCLRGDEGSNFRLGESKGLSKCEAKTTVIPILAFPLLVLQLELRQHTRRD
jgi:hypothetical protein